MFFPKRYRARRSLVFAFKATHNHFVYDRGGKVFNRPAPAVILLPESSDGEHYHLLTLLNSSVASVWEREVHRHVSGAGEEPWEVRLERNATKVADFPLPDGDLSWRGERVDEAARLYFASCPSSIIERWKGDSLQEVQKDDSLGRLLQAAKDRASLMMAQMISLQEEIDWECYRLFGLLDDDLTIDTPPSIELGQRAFEIYMARQIAAGDLTTTWFERHGSVPITEIPDHWPDDYRRLVERRIKLIQTDTNINLVERPEYKRRWTTESWESQLQRALCRWLLERLESYFDFDGRMNADNKPTAQLDISLTSAAKLADVARQDPQFMEVGEVYSDDPAFDVQHLVADLVQAESVPLLPVLRYKPSGLRKRKEWDSTWELQRQEDAIDAREQLPKEDPQYLTEDQARDLKQREIGKIPVPPKFASSDFISTGGARYWTLRGKLDVPKERWISFPHCEGPDGTLVVAWAGYDHLQVARAVSAYYVDIQERLGGRDDPRLIPLLACIIELLPWLKQWHHEIDPDYNQRMDEVFEGFITEEAKGLGLTVQEVTAWQP